MARWRLTEAHYLNGRPPDLEEVEWEHKETDRLTGRENRKRFKVPFYFDNDTIVCYEGKGQRGDFVFEGPPTPAMEPLDEEAEAISNAHRKDWVHPIDSLSGNGFDLKALEGMWSQQFAAMAAAMPKAPVAVAESGVSRTEFEALQEQMKTLLARNAELEGDLNDTPPMPPPTPTPRGSVRKVA
jgi:hypothetical protein